MPTKFEVVISGISGRFPECDDVITLKNKLYSLDNFITVNNKKWSTGYKYKFGSHIIPNGTGKYTSTEPFDIRVFKLNPELGVSYDILNRKVLEPSFEAIVDAGVNPYSLDGENVGVFMSCGINEVESKLSEDDSITQKKLIGISRTMQSNRVSYAFNFTGPSYTYQTDVFGSLQALSTACNAVADGTINAAVVGVASNMMDPKVFLQYLSLDLLSPDGLCRAFDKHANGYGRSEGTVVLFLQRAEEAKRNYASVLFCDTYYFGMNSSTIIGHKQNALRNVLETIYAENNFTDMSSELAFMELNACGIKKLESMESNSIAEVVCRNRKHPLLVGSVKSNIGHTEASAAFMSLLKTLFALDSNTIAPNANLITVDEEINAFKEKKLQVVDKITKLTGDLVGINAIGLGGVISHAVLKQNPKEPKTDKGDSHHRLLLICGRTEDGLRSIINKIEQLPFNPEFVALTNDSFSSYMPAHLYRGYTILPKFATSGKATSRVEERGDRNRPVWFVFSGMGSQWNGMGKGLLDIPIFAEVIAKCDLVLSPKGIDIYHILTSDDPTLFEEILNSFVAIICVQIGLIEILKALRIQPDGLIGHSLGETSVAYADGCLTLEQAVLSAYIRGMASVGTKTIRGMMAAVGKGYEEIKNSVPADVEVACHNSDTSCTLSGPAEKVEKFLQQLTANGVFARMVNTGNIAYHSKYVAPAAPKLLSKLEEVILQPKERSPKWISTSIPECDWNKPLAKYCTAEYFTNNFVSPVLFEEGCKHVPKDAILIEIAPHGLLQAILKRALPKTCANISLTCRSKTEENIYNLLTAIGKLYIAGCEPDVNAIFPKVNYPVSRNTPPISPFCDWFHEDMNASKKFLQPNPEKPLSSELIPIQINEDTDFHYLKFHKIKDHIVIPPSMYMYLVWWMLSVKRNEKVGTSSVVFENVKFHKHIRISIKKPRFVTIMIQASGNFEVLLENDANPNSIVVVVSGKIETTSEDSAKVNLNKAPLNDMKVTKISEKQFYSKYNDAGFQLTNCFAPVRELLSQKNECYSKITWNNNWVTFLDSLMKIQMFSRIQSESELRHPYSIRKLTICCPQFAALREGDVVLCHQDLVTKKIQCNGLEMYGFDSKKSESKLLPADSSGTRFAGLQFVSYANPKCKDTRQFLELCLHIAVQNLYAMEKSPNAKLFILKSTLDYAKSIRSVIKQNNILKSKITFFDDQDLRSEKSSLRNKCFLLVARDLSSVNGFCFDHLFLLIESSAPNLQTSIPETFVLITEQNFSGKLCSLYKKKSIINGSTHALICNDNNSKNIRDFNSNNKEQPRYIVRSGIGTNDIALILSADKIPDYNSRYMFLTDDDNNSSLEDTDRLIKSQIDKDLPISILKKGEWGIYKHNFTDEKMNDDRHKSSRIFETDIRLESVDTRFFATECNEGIFENSEFSKPFLHGVEYSGIHRSGKRVMGVAVVDHMARPDPILAWQIPKEWSLEDAVTVPFIYMQAHYIEWVTRGFGFASSILINMGDKYLLTETCISLYLRKNYCVYVTVSSREQAANITKKFPKLEKSHIFYEKKCAYENQLLQLTKGKGADIIINCLSGFKHVTASLNCVGKFAHYVEIGDNNCSDVYSLGMNPFLKSIACTIIPNEISFLVNLPEETKIILQAQIEDAIKRGLVKPLPRVVLNQAVPKNYYLGHQREAKRIVKCFTGNEISSMKSSNLKYGESCSYIIVADGDTWIDLGEWLVGKGVRKLIVILDDVSNTSSTSYRCQTIFNTKKLSISFKSSDEIATVENAVAVITEANKLASLQAVYFVSLKGGSGQKIRNMDMATRSCNTNVFLISLFSGGVEQLELRHSKGLPGVVIHADRNYEKITNVLSVLDELLKNYSVQCSTNFYEILGETHKPEETKVKFSELSTYLPKNLKTLENTGNDMTKTITFREKTSLSATYAEIKGVYPVFVMPVVDASHMEPLLRKLFYPVFCASLSEYSYTLSEMSSEIFQALNKIQPSGPVTILSETWNASVAIEVAALISSAKRKFKLFLLEGDPHQWKNRIESLGSVHSTQFDDNFVKELFAFNSKINFDMDLNSTDTLEEKIKCCLSKFDTKEVNRDSVIKAAYALRNQLRIASHYDVKDKVLENVTLFLQNFSENSPLKLSVTSDIVLLEEGISYERFIRDDKISRKINDNAAFSWWDHPK